MIIVFLMVGVNTAAAKSSVVANNSAVNYIVVYKPSVNVSEKAKALTSKGQHVKRTFRSAFNGLLVSLTAIEAENLAKNNDVVMLEKDAPVTISAAGAVSRSALSWGLDRLDQRLLPLNNRISTSQNGFGIKTYVVDTGIRFDHTEFSGRAQPGFDVIGDGQNGSDCNGHGTHVAGTVGGTNYGVAPQVSLVAVRVLNCSGSGTISGVIAGLNWVIENHLAGQPAVANISLGGSYSAALNTATANTVADGVSVAVAAGNSNANACNYSPASAPSAITVGATANTDWRASYSNYGSCLDLFAPGSSIKSAWNSSSSALGTISGTSMAAPHVAGVAALILSGNPASTPAQVAALLSSSATLNVVKSAGARSPNRLLFTN